MKGRLAVRYDSAGHIIKQEVSEDKAQVTDIETLMEIAITNKAAGKNGPLGLAELGGGGVWGCP